MLLSSGDGIKYENQVVKVSRGGSLGAKGVRTTTPCTFTEEQKAFIGPHHQTKISRQKQPINH